MQIGLDSFWPCPNGWDGFSPPLKKEEGGGGSVGPLVGLDPFRPSPYGLAKSSTIYISYNNNKNSKGYFKIFVIFSQVFPIILYNIELYIYIVRYKSSIKIANILRNVSKFFKKIKKKSQKYFKLISF